MKSIIIANWKMHLTLDEALVRAKILNRLDHSVKLLLAPPAPYLYPIASDCKELTICSQDISKFSAFGAYTGEYSGRMLTNCGVSYAIVGHSERRMLLNETNVIVQQKVQNCIDSNITPILCIGESLNTRKNNSFKQFLDQQITESVPNDLCCDDKMIIAYEPIWSIGSNIVPTIDEVSEIFNLIKNNKRISIIANNIQLVYGGSVNIENYQTILSITGNNGVILGSASLHENHLQQILQYSY